VQGPDSNFQGLFCDPQIIRESSTPVSTRRTTTLGEDGDPGNTTCTITLIPTHEKPNCGAFTMPLTTPVLTVDADNIHKVDTANAQSLHGMWMGKLGIY
jgi:hypothetical protein